MAGFDAPYVPGYDCHGLPIEIKVDEQLGRKKLEMPVPEVLEACRAYAQKYVDLQTSQFERIGCFGRWDKPYKTMSRDYEARTLEAFYGFLEKGFVYRGLKPVYWCIHDRTALAEAEVEYEMHTSPSVYVRYRLTSDPAAIDPPRWPARGLHHHLDHHPLDAARVDGRGLPSRLSSTSGAWSRVPRRRGRAGLHRRRRTGRSRWRAACKLGATTELARFKGSGARPRHLPASVPGPQHSGRLATYVTADTGTGAVHTAPSHGADDFYTGQRYNLDPPAASMPPATSMWTPSAWNHAAPPAFEGMKVWAANPSLWPCWKSAARCWPARSGALLPALLALPQAGHLRATEQWFIGWKRRSSARTARRRPSASWPSKRSTRWSGTRPGARSASPT
jgi:isoleucyl-tRNA synthetase